MLGRLARRLFRMELHLGELLLYGLLIVTLLTVSGCAHDLKSPGEYCLVYTVIPDHSIIDATEAGWLALEFNEIAFERLCEE